MILCSSQCWCTHGWDLRLGPPRPKSHRRRPPSLQTTSQSRRSVVRAEKVAADQDLIEVAVNSDALKKLDMSPMAWLQEYTSDDSKLLSFVSKKKVAFSIQYTREDELDPREVSEIPEIRLWFLRLDTLHPWLPLVLDWRGGELTRYTAMMIPHQMSQKSGIMFNPEAMELFITAKLFICYDFLKRIGYDRPQVRLVEMAKMMGLELSPRFFDKIQ